MKNLLLTLALASFVTLAVPALAKNNNKTPNKNTNEVTATGKIVSVVKNAITIAIGDDQNHQKTFTVKKHTIINLDGKTAQIGSLVVGEEVTVKTKDQTTLEAKEIDAHAA